MNEKDIFYKLYGGLNTDKYPFNIGDKLRQIYRIDSKGNLIDGREEVEFIGMKGDMMLLKALNKYAFFKEDTLNPSLVRWMKCTRKFKPNTINQLHYMYADRFKKFI